MTVVGSINYGVAGIPQWMMQRCIAATSGAIGSNNECDSACVNNLSGATAPYNQAVTASHIINAGPISSGIISVIHNGVVWGVPFNIPVTLPDYIWQVLTASVAGVPATYSGL